MIENDNSGRQGGWIHSGALSTYLNTHGYCLPEMPNRKWNPSSEGKEMSKRTTILRFAKPAGKT